MGERTRTNRNDVSKVQGIIELYKTLLNEMCVVI